MMTYETDFRPNYELQLACVWAAGGAACLLAMVFYSGFPLAVSMAMSACFFIVAGYQGFFARARQQRLRALERQDLNFYSLADLAEEMRQGELFIGQGFDWTGVQAQQVSDLHHDPERLADLKRSRRGATYLQGLGAAQQKPIYLLDDETKGHVGIFGTTGAGKTRLFDLLISQSILRNEPVIILDPKGDRELRLNMEAAYARAGRSDAFSFFHPSFVAESAAINPLASFQRETELASRLAAVIPSSPSGDVFQAFSQNALAGIFFAVLMGGTNPTIMDVQRALSEGFGPLCVKALQGWAQRVSPEMASALGAAMAAKPRSNRAINDNDRAVAGARFYQEMSAKDLTLGSAEMNNLISLLLHDPDHFKKMVASLVPVVGKLCSGPLQTLFSPDPAAKRMPPSGKVISLRNVIDSAGGVYIGLDTLSDPDVGRAMGQMILADLASLAGANYNHGRARGRFINVFVDEASEITNEQLIQLLNKGRGAGFRMFVATQTLADFEARTGSAAMASMLIGNMNTTIILRTKDVDTQERLSKSLPEVPISTIMRSAASSLGETSIAGAFSVSHGERLVTELQPIISPQTLGDLSDLEFFAQTARGTLLKGRLPILDPPEEQHTPSASVRYADIEVLRQRASEAEVEAEAIAPQPQAAIQRPVVETFDIAAPAAGRFNWHLPMNWVAVLPKLRDRL